MFGKEWLLLIVFWRSTTVLVSRLDIGCGQQRVVKNDCRFFGVSCRINDVSFPEKENSGGEDVWGEGEST